MTHLQYAAKIHRKLDEELNSILFGVAHICLWRARYADYNVSLQAIEIAKRIILKDAEYVLYKLDRELNNILFDVAYVRHW